MECHKGFERCSTGVDWEIPINTTIWGPGNLFGIPSCCFAWPKHGKSPTTDLELLSSALAQSVGNPNRVAERIFPSKIEWDLTNGPQSKLRSSYQILRFFRGPWNVGKNLRWSDFLGPIHHQCFAYSSNTINGRHIFGSVGSYCTELPDSEDVKLPK